MPTLVLPEMELMKQKSKRLLATVVVLAGLGVFFFLLITVNGDKKGKSEQPVVIARPDNTETIQAPPGEIPQPQEIETPAPAAPNEQTSAASELYRQGIELFQSGSTKNLIDARSALSEALFSGALTADQQEMAVNILAELSQLTILSPNVLEDDPYCFYYTFQSGEVLQRVERKLNLHIPPQLILKVNRIADATKIRAGQRLKMIQGPFHAIVNKSSFTMDLFLHREGSPKVFVKRLGVGLGMNGSTPMGMWRVALGKKMVQAPWNPPPNSQHQHKILWGEPDYPLGAQGYWISLEGIDENTNPHVGYGIHGTNEPESIGKAESLGCIRLVDADIELAFASLYEFWSTVKIRE